MLYGRTDDFDEEIVDETSMTLAQAVGTSIRRFDYVYDFGDNWEHEIVVEKVIAGNSGSERPFCIGGKRHRPPEDCGGPQAFLDRRASAPWRVRELLDDLLEGVKARDADALDYCLEELQPWQEWLMLHRFDRRKVNRLLRQYAQGTSGAMNSTGGWQ